MENENWINFVDLTGCFDRTPTNDEVKMFLNSMAQLGRKFKTLSSDWYVIVPKSSKKIKHIRNSSQFEYMNKSQIRRHNKYILAVETLLANAIYIGEKENDKKKEKPNIYKYHYFKTKVKMNDNIYEIIIDTEERINDSTTKPQTVYLYDINEKKNSSLSANFFKGR